MQIRVYYEDTDAGGIVYYANYLKFFERARTEWLRNLGINQQDLLLSDIGFVVTEVMMKNKGSAVFNDFLQVSTEIKQLRKASVVFSQKITKQDLTNATCLIAEAEIKVACVDISAMKAKSIPPEVIKELHRVA